MLEPPDLAIIIASVPVQTAVADALFKLRDEQSRTCFGVGLPFREIVSKRIPEFDWERLALHDHELVGRDRGCGIRHVAGKFRPGHRAD
jgi:hypothetical protein